MKKVLAISAIRSDYDLMSGIYRYLSQDETIELKLLVTGAHLSPASGYSVKEIEKDNIDILMKIESLIHADSMTSRIKSASIFLQASIDIVQNYRPDIILFAGDREEAMMGGLLGAYLNIPSIHFFGGDHAKDGHVDNPVRHAVSKLSSAHFVTLEEHKQRLINMGESQERIFVIGNPALDRFNSEEIVSIADLKTHFTINSGFDKFAVVIFHPITEEIAIAHEYFDCILTELKQRNIHAFVSYPNVDPGNSSIIDVIEKHEREGDGFFRFYKNLDRKIFVSIFKQAAFIIGNSSAGILEAASVPMPAINVGQRQVGRYAGENVIFCQGDKKSIAEAVEKAISEPFRKTVLGMTNPYGKGESSMEAYRLIKSVDFGALRFKKEDALEREDNNA